MADLQVLCVVLAALYLWECGAWLQRGSVGFRTWLGRRWRVTFPSNLAGNVRGGWVMGMPLPPLGALHVTVPLPLSVGPEGILGYVASSLDPAGRPPQGGRYFEFGEVRSIQSRGRTVWVNDAPLVTVDSAVCAGRLARWLESLRRGPPAQRSEEIARYWKEAFDSGSIRRLCENFAASTRCVRWWCNGYFVFLFGVAPLLVGWFELRRVWPALLMLLVILGSGTAWCFRRAHRRWYPDAADDRFSQTLMVLLSPPSGVRAGDLLARPLLDAYHPLAVAAALCSSATFRRLGHRTLKECLYPARPTAPAEPAAAGKLEADMRGMVERASRALLRQQGVDPEELLCSPKPLDATCHSWCPRCAAQFTAATGECPDCGGLPLQPLVRARGKP